MPHFFINSSQIKSGTAEISDKENYRHIARSLRAKSGEELFLIDENQIQYETVINQITNSKITAVIKKSYKSKRILDFNLYLAQAPLRSDAQNFIVEKATELGVKAIIPILSDNCSLSKSVIENKIPKWQKIMYESSKQCERAKVPACESLAKIEDVVFDKSYDRIFIFAERNAKTTIREAFLKSPIKNGQKIGVIIGPEGGFSQQEFNLFKDLESKNSKIEILTLGDMILRAETAVTVALGNIIYEYSNFKG